MIAFATDRLSREPEEKKNELPPGYMTATEASQRINVSYDEIVQALESAVLGGALAPGHGWIVSESTLERWQARRTAAVQGNG